MHRLNLGCGIAPIEGFTNIDNSPNILLSRFPLVKKALHAVRVLKQAHMADFNVGITYMNLPQGLRRYAPLSADRIYTSHFIEHLPPRRALLLLRECHRILAPAGIMRIVLPDAAAMARKYVSLVEEAIATESDTTEPRDQLAQGLVGALVTKRRSGHRSIWDLPSLRKTLLDIGFKDVRTCSFQKGLDQTMASRDNRPGNSLFVEAVKQ